MDGLHSSSSVSWNLPMHLHDVPQYIGSFHILAVTTSFSTFLAHHWKAICGNG